MKIKLWDEWMNSESGPWLTAVCGIVFAVIVAAVN